MIEIDVDQSQIADVIQGLDATKKDIARAHNRALQRAVVKLKTMALKHLSRELQVTQKILKTKVRQFKSGGRRGTLPSQKLWFGLNPVMLGSLSPKKSGKGVRAGKHKVANGFIQRGQVFSRVGQSKYPIKIHKLEVEEEALGFIESTIIPEFEDEYLRVFERELTFRVTGA